MGLDIKQLISDAEAVRESQRRRFQPVEIIDEILAKHDEWKTLDAKVNSLNRDVNALSKQVGQKKKAKEPCDDLVAEVKKVKLEQAEAKQRKEQLQGERDRMLAGMGNLVHQSVPVSETEDDNEVVAVWGDDKHRPPHLEEGETIRPHYELLTMIDGWVHEPAGTTTAGHRGYFLKGPGAMLNMALQAYATQWMLERDPDFVPLQPPYFMRHEIMAETAQLETFQEDLYKVVESTDESHKNDEAKYLIATSEQPISALHRNEYIQPADLPIKYLGQSTCFRKEAGAYGKDVAGIFRVHQFDKIEQFVITSPEESWSMHTKMRENAELFHQSLELPYQVVAIVSKELNNAAAKKWDIECWFPGFDKYRELVSCSNCTDYQSRAMSVRYGNPKSKGDTEGVQMIEYVHMLNSTLCACTRAICCILENWQTSKGVIVPPPLRPFMNGKEFMPFVKEYKEKVNNVKKGKGGGSKK